MFVDVEPFFLYTGRDAEAMYDIESFKDHKSHSCRPASYHDGSEKLCQQEICATGVEEAFFGGEQSGQYGSEESADSVYR